MTNNQEILEKHPDYLERQKWKWTNVEKFQSFLTIEILHNEVLCGKTISAPNSYTRRPSSLTNRCYRHGKGFHVGG